MKYLIILLMFVSLAAYGAADRITEQNKSYLKDSGSANRIGLLPPSLSSSWDWTLPTTAGTSGQALYNTGAGAINWFTPKNVALSTLADKAVSSAWKPGNSVGAASSLVYIWVPELHMIATIVSGVTNDTFAYSLDGIKWFTGGILPNTNGLTADMTWSPQLGLFVAVKNASSGGFEISTSPDGIIWTLQTTPADNQWQAIVWAPEISLFVVVGMLGGTQQAMTSPDGINWTLRTTPSTSLLWTAVTWAPELGLFAAVAGTGEAMTSGANSGGTNHDGRPGTTPGGGGGAPFNGGTGGGGAAHIRGVISNPGAMAYSVGVAAAQYTGCTAQQPGVGGQGALTIWEHFQ